MDPIRIVPTADAYVESFHRCLDVVARERRYLAFLEAPPLEGLRAFVQSIASGAGVQFLAVDTAGTVVGWCDIVPNSREGFRHSGQLGMGVLPEARRARVGTRLASAAIDGAWAAGLHRVELDVFATNEHAVSLYRTLGFVTEGVKRHARQLDGVYDDVVVMSLLREREP